MDFANLKSLSIPEGEAKEIYSGDVLLWKGGYTNILDTIGYDDGYRCRTSGVTLGALEGATAFRWYDCSNLTETDVIRIYLPNGIPEAETSAYAAHCTSADETTSISLGMYTQSRLDVFRTMFDSCSYSDKIITLTNRKKYLILILLKIKK